MCGCECVSVCGQQQVCSADTSQVRLGNEKISALLYHWCRGFTRPVAEIDCISQRSRLREEAGNSRPGGNGKFRIPEPPDSSPSLIQTLPSETPDMDLCARRSGFLCAGGLSSLSWDSYLPWMFWSLWAPALILDQACQGSPHRLPHPSTFHRRGLGIRQGCWEGFLAL